MFHTTMHIEQVAHFMSRVLKCYKIKTLNDSALGNRDHFDVIMTCSAYMHDICHPVQSPVNRKKIEQLTNDFIRKSDGSSIGLGCYRHSIDIKLHIDKVLVDVSSAKLESMHAIIGVHYASDAFIFSEYQKAFMMCMIISTELSSYDDIKEMNTITPTIKDIGKVMMRCSDLSHFTLSWKQHLLWVNRLCQEMKCEISAKNQVSFIDNKVLPQFKMLYCFCRCECTLDWISSIQSNRSVWESIANEKGTQKPENIGEIAFLSV